MKTEKISLLIGGILTILFTFVGFQSLKYKKTIDIRRESGSWHEALESLDLRYNDFKYKFRKPRPSGAPVALVAIDDDSVREIGRWPWSREVMAEITRRLIDLGAKSVAFDAIFSETSTPEGDALFGKVVTDHPDKVILGTFSDNLLDVQPYQDICVAEGFLRTRGDQIAKLNPTFVLDDQAEGALEELEWSPLFEILFENIRRQAHEETLKGFGKKSVEELTQYQKNALQAAESGSLFEYCQRWLTPQDPFLQADLIEKIRPLYDKVVAASPTLKNLTLEQLIAKLKTDIKAHPIPQYGQWTPNITFLQDPANFTASFETKLDDDGYVRRYPLFYRSGNKLGSSFLPSLALQSYLISQGYRAEVKVGMDATVGSKVIQEFTIYDTKTTPETKVTTLPTDSMGQMLVNYYGPQMSLPYISAREILNDKPTFHVQTNAQNSKTQKINIREDEVDKKEFLKDRSLIFGATAVGIYDLRNVPIEKNYPGPEIHVSMLANLLNNDFLRAPPKEDVWLPILLVILGAGLTTAWSFLGPLSSMALMFCTLGVVTGIDFMLFLKWGILSSFLFLILEIIGIYFAITVYKYFTEERHKRAVKSTFSKYVSPAVVDELLKEPDKLKLGGRKQRMSVFFSDVRGFTTISEKLSPEDLSKLLNRYLSPMTEIVFENKGTLDKYMGDAIMAFFGAPIFYEDHAAHACRCALKSLVKLKELQTALAAEGLPSIDIGIGINTGEMSVGNMGSNIVQNYTVMGDSVNLASRLEGINKEYGTRIIISQFTYEDVKNTFCAREVDRVRVKGKLEPVRIFEVIAEGEAPPERKEALALFAQGYETYMNKKFPEAKALFQQVLAKDPTDPVAELYIERCNEFLVEPPPAEWDGVFIMKTK